ncbi:MAG: tRNA (N6-threonylcarbamoyladenosine(37)-N6)-methyltransferase TrmO [Clostridiaceae bacterium]|nr:tRNA (N6-threonylcarbamoyladenosine(37)-N6)-methyltransferase TrmO [Clostridiaceae bacterium]
MKIEFESIGEVKNAVQNKKDTNWGSDVSQIVIDERYEKGLTGLSEFSHIIVVYYLDKARFSMDEHLVRRPQNREDMPMVGILSQRAKDRPNPIGITSCELMAVDGNVVSVKGLDAIDGTPVLDIKPYYPMYDCKNTAIVPEWVKRLMAHYF